MSNHRYQTRSRTRVQKKGGQSNHHYWTLVLSLLSCVLRKYYYTHDNTLLLQQQEPIHLLPIKKIQWYNSQCTNDVEFSCGLIKPINNVKKTFDFYTCPVENQPACGILKPSETEKRANNVAVLLLQLTLYIWLTQFIIAKYII